MMCRPWSTAATPARAAVKCWIVRGAAPRKRISPARSRATPRKVFTTVLLPTPLRPRIATRSFSLTARSIPWSTRASP